MIHLDTSFLIRALVPASPEDRVLRIWLKNRVPLAMSSIGWSEFLCGPVDGSHLGLVRSIVRDVLPFQEEDAVLAAGLFNRSGRRRGTHADCVIAAAAIRAGAPLASANPADFKRFVGEGLELSPLDVPSIRATASTEEVVRIVRKARGRRRGRKRPVR